MRSARYLDGREYLAAIIQTLGISGWEEQANSWMAEQLSSLQRTCLSGCFRKMQYLKTNFLNLKFFRTVSPLKILLYCRWKFFRCHSGRAFQEHIEEKEAFGGCCSRRIHRWRTVSSLRGSSASLSCQETLLRRLSCETVVWESWATRCWGTKKTCVFFA